MTWMHPLSTSMMFLVVFQSMQLGQVYSAHWSYDGENGVKFWSRLKLDPSKNECGNSSQSPIHIQVRSTICAYSPMRYINYRMPLLSPYIFNNGHTVQVSAPRDRHHGVWLSHPASPFRFLQLHFHWGSDSARGSEHVVDDNRYCMEMHLVHVNTKYGSAEEASKHHDGLAVVAVLFKAGRKENPNFKVIVDAVRKIETKENVRRNIEECVVLSHLLPANKVGHFQYFGSLTTPPCSEVVTWIVLREPVTVSESQMDVFRKVQAPGHDNGTTHVLVDNYRSPMPLNGRYVLRNFLCPPLRKGPTKMHVPVRTPDAVEGQE